MNILYRIRKCLLEHTFKEDMNMIIEAIAAVVNGKDLDKEMAAAVMDEIMSGEATQAQIGSFLTAL